MDHLHDRMHGPLRPRCRVLRIRTQSDGPVHGCGLRPGRVLGVLGQALRRCGLPSAGQPEAHQVRGAMRQEPHPHSGERQGCRRGRRIQRDRRLRRRAGNPRLHGPARQARDHRSHHQMPHGSGDKTDRGAIQGPGDQAGGEMGPVQHPRMRPRRHEMGAPRAGNGRRMRRQKALSR